MAELRAERERVELLARQHALRTALDYYFPGALEPELDLVHSLKQMVFSTWLEEHAFSEKFEPMRGFGLS